MRRVTRLPVLLLAAAATAGPLAPMRAAVADSAPGPLTVTAASTAPDYPDPTVGGTLPQVHGTVSDADGAGVGGLSVSLTYTDADHQTPVPDGAAATTADDGSYALQPGEPVRTGPQGLFESRTYTVVVAGSPSLASAPLHIGVPGAFALISDSGSYATPGNPYWAIQGQVSGPVGSVVVGQVKTAGGWRTVSTARSYAYGTLGVNRFSVDFPGRSTGTQTVRAVRVTDAYQDEVDTVGTTVTYDWRHLAGNPSRYSFADVVTEKPATSAGPATPPVRPAPAQPLRFSPCTPITWAFNPAGAPAGALALVEQAFLQAGHYSGYHFRYVGTTQERPSQADANKRASSGRGPAILVKWVRASGETDLARNLRDVAGVGASTVLSSPRTRPRLAGGSLLLVQKPGGVDLPMDFGPFSWGPEVLHEIGSVLGLRPVPDTRQIMYAKAGVASRYGAGDVAGLAKLGRTPGC